MGNFFSIIFTPKKKMHVPRSLDELCDTVNWKDPQLKDWPGLEALALRSAWVKSFLDSARAREAGRAHIFLFYLACTGLEKNLGAGLDLQLLREMQRVFFGDMEFYQPSLHFVDLNNTVDDIFSLFGSDLTKIDTVTKLKKKLLALKQDEAVRSGLDSAFISFLKSKQLHPSSLHQCILSIL